MTNVSASIQFGLEPDGLMSDDRDSDLIHGWPNPTDDQVSGSARMNAVAGAVPSDVSNAFTKLADAIKLHPGDPTLYFNRGNLRAEQGDYQRAIGNYDRAIELAPDFVEAYRNRGNLLFVRQRGSHRRFRDDETGRVVTVAVRGGDTFKTPTLRSIIEIQAQWNRADLVRLDWSGIRRREAALVFRIPAVR